MTKYQYDADGNQTEMSQQTSTGWNVTDTYYNAEGQPWDVLGPAVNGVRPETVTLYDLDGESCESQVKQADANGGNVQWAVTDTTYDADGNAYQTVSPANAAGVRPTSYSFYNGLGEMCFSQTPLDVTAGEYTQYKYDTLGEQTEVVGPAAGGVSSDTKTTYDAADNAVTSKVLKAALSGGTTWETTTTDYDNDGNVVSKTDPDNDTTSYSYDAAGDMLTETDPDGQTTVDTYDAAGDMLTTDVDGQTTTNVYDAFGDETSSTDPRQQTTTYTVDAFGQVVAQTQPGASATETVYNDLGQMTSQTDSDGKTTDYCYDAEGRCIQTTDSDGQTTTYQYDLDGNRTSMTDPDGNTTTTAYDLDGNKISQTVTNSSGATVGSQQWSYDADGNCTSSTDADGRTTKYQYDVNDQLIGEQWYDAQDNCTNTVQYSYDSLDELLDVSDDFSHYSYTYDALGHETSETIQNQGQPTVVLTDSYDAAGTNATGDDLRTGLSATIDGTPDFRNSYAYNADGQLGQVVQEGQAGGNAVAYKQVDFGYNADDQVASIDRYVSSGSGTTLAAHSAYGYDDRGNMTDLTDSADAAGTNVLSAYHWNNDGDDRVTDAYSYADAGSGAVLSDPTTWAHAAYNYDADGQLATTAADGTTTHAVTYTNWVNAPGSTSANPTSGVEDYNYDSNGNRTSANGSAYATGGDNQMTTGAGYSYQYDANGNRIAQWVDNNNVAETSPQPGDSDITTYKWDNRNRLVEVDTYSTYAKYSAQTPDQTVTNVYDTSNRWIGETVTTYDSSGVGTVVENRGFVYDGDQIALQFDKSGAGSLAATDLSQRYLWGPAVNQLLAQETPGAAISGLMQAGAVDWALTDNLGTVRDMAVYNATTGATNIAMHRVYDSYGNMTSQTNPSASLGVAAVDCLFGYTGKAFDRATGLQNNLNRWFDPSVGTWLSEDPAAADENLYRYAGDGPTDGTDPRGLAEPSRKEVEYNGAFWWYADGSGGAPVCHRRATTTSLSVGKDCCIARRVRHRKIQGRHHR